MGTSFTPKSTTTTIPEIPINSRIVIQPGIHYTCPAGKKAIFTGTVACTNRGAAAEARLRDPTDSFNLAEWDRSAVAVSYTESYFALAHGQTIPITIELTAGQEIKTTQDVGTNAEFNVVGKILELPA